MEKQLFIESIKVVNGQFVHPQLHLKRIQSTQREVFGQAVPLELTPQLVPAEKCQGTVKCRIIYDHDIRQIGFDFYIPRPINSLKVTDGGNIDYHLKQADRRCFTDLLKHKGECDDILIVRYGQVTDTSYSNVVFYDGKEYFTPRTYLLNGTRRQFLLQQGMIKEANIRLEDLPHFECLYLINAMIGLEDNIKVNIPNIKYQ